MSRKFFQICVRLYEEPICNCLLHANWWYLFIVALALETVNQTVSNCNNWNLKLLNLKTFQSYGLQKWRLIVIKPKTNSWVLHLILLIEVCLLYNLIFCGGKLHNTRCLVLVLHVAYHAETWNVICSILSVQAIKSACFHSLLYLILKFELCALLWMFS